MDCPGYETGSFNVNEYGVYRFDIAEPVSIVKKTAEGGALTGVKYL